LRQSSQRLARGIERVRSEKRDLSICAAERRTGEHRAFAPHRPKADLTQTSCEVEGKNFKFAHELRRVNLLAPTRSKTKCHRREQGTMRVNKKRRLCVLRCEIRVPCFERFSTHPSRISRKFVSKFEIFALYFAGGFVMGAMRPTDPGAQGGGGIGHARKRLQLKNNFPALQQTLSYVIPALERA
jgi:hypothetical protein